MLSYVLIRNLVRKNSESLLSGELFTCGFNGEGQLGVGHTLVVVIGVFDLRLMVGAAANSPANHCPRRPCPCGRVWACCDGMRRITLAFPKNAKVASYLFGRYIERAQNTSAGFKELVGSYEQQLLKKALESGRYNQKKSAALLGLTYDQFRGLLRKYRDQLDTG